MAKRNSAKKGNGHALKFNLFVASYAKPRNARPTKAEKRLAGRIKDYDTIKDKLGYHIPGSLQ